ncbi:MAG TPA: hypothetical protein PLR99_26185 [Polyangiaceae bacterium]|jgi:hypothetical protein|nr:hypothetical protein [Polyangiaceae bacterium]
MKLRTRGNSLRLRLTRSEVARLAEGGEVTDRVEFGAGAALSYTIASANVPHVRATLEGAHVRVEAPPAVVRDWAATEQVGFEGSQPLDGGRALKILVEKDWTCLTKREGDEDVDTYPHPHETC